MSHFVTMIVIPEGTVGKEVHAQIDEILAPFQENNMGDCPKQYLEFNDLEDEMLKEYEEGTVEKVVMPDGRLLNTWDEEFRPKRPDGKPNLFERAEPPADLERRKVPFKELYDTFEDFAKEWHGREKRDEVYNRFGYWENPNAKWDWYEIGGRWSGYFLLKDGKVGIKGRQYNMGQQYEKSQKADVCYKGDIDWEKMRNDAAKDAGKRWDLVHKAWEGLVPLESWDSIRERHGEGNIEPARKEYWAQPRVKVLQTREIQDEIGWLAEIDRYQVPREEFLRRAMEQVGVSHSVIKDGKWYENGRMGWWGVVTDEKDPETWASMFSKMIDELPDRAILAAVDCHI